ncbi:MAG: hypothetical protein ACYTEE_11170 [Planctomycetota bacterium]
MSFYTHPPGGWQKIEWADYGGIDSHSENSGVDGVGGLGDFYGIKQMR